VSEEQQAEAHAQADAAYFPGVVAAEELLPRYEEEPPHQNNSEIPIGATTNEAVAPCSEYVLGVPAWAIASEVKDDDIYPDGAAPSCISWLRGAVVVAIMLQGGILALSKVTSTCVGGRVRSEPWVYAAMLPAMAFRGMVEWRVVRHMILPVVRHGRLNGETCFKLMGQQVSFPTWLTICGVSSLTNFLDMGTDSIFTATSTGTLTCDGGYELRQMWHAQWAQSLSARLGMPAPDLGKLVLGFWALALLQLVWPLLKSLEVFCPKDPVFYGFVSRMLGRFVAYDDVACDLGEACGMTTLQKLQIIHASAMVEQRAGMVDRQLVYVAPLGDSMASKVFLSWIMENAVQVNLQATLFALTKHTSKGGDEAITCAQVEALASIAISIMGTLLKLAEAWDFFKIVSPVVQAAERWPLDEDGQARLKALRRAVWAVRVGCAVLVAALGYAAAKLIGALACEDGLLNLTGCAAIEV